MDYKEEQQQEIEILQSIYPDELFIESETKFSISLLLETSSSKKHRLKLNIQYPETYPEVAPELDVEIGKLLESGSAKDPKLEQKKEDKDDEADKIVILSETIKFDDDDLQQLRNELIEEAEEQIGIPSVFTIASSLKEKAEVLFEKKLQKEEKIHNEERMAKEREEQKKFYGTKVTKESFLEWRVKFRKELKIDEKLDQRKLSYHKGKMTGKEIFEKGLVNDDDVDDNVEDISSGVEKLTT